MTRRNILAGAKPDAEQPENGKPEGPADLLPIIDIRALAASTPANKQFAIERLAPLAEVTLFTGPGSAGKSLLSQQFATAAAAGRSCLGLSVMAGPAIYLTCEDDPDQLHWRQTHICCAMGVDMASLAGRLHLISLRGALDNDLGTFAAEGTLKPSNAYGRLVTTIKATDAKLAFLDNVAHLFTGNENDRGNVTRFVNLLNRLAGETGAAIVLLGHPPKSGADYSGSTAWLNAVRSQFTIDHERDSHGAILDADKRTVTLGKANYTSNGDVVAFRWHDWAFVLESDLPTDTRAEIAETAKANSENKAFLACLRERNRQQRHVSDKPTAANYAPKQFAGMAEAKGFKKAQLEGAMDRLFRINAIERGFLWRDTGEGKDIYGVREVSPDNLEPSPKTSPKRADEIPETSPETCRKHIPETSGNPQKTTGNTLPISKDIPGAANRAATPVEVTAWDEAGACDPPFAAR